MSQEYTCICVDTLHKGDIDDVIIIIIIIIINLSDIVLNEEREKTCLLIDIAIPDYSKFNTQKIRKTKQVQKPGYHCQQDVESEDKNCASYDWSIRNN